MKRISPYMSLSALLMLIEVPEAVRTLILVMKIASIISGEAPYCPEGQLLVASVIQNRFPHEQLEGWYGNAEPETHAIVLAYHVVTGVFPDVSKGAYFLFGERDLADSRVLDLTSSLVLTQRVSCPSGDLTSWRYP